MVDFGINMVNIAFFISIVKGTFVRRKLKESEKQGIQVRKKKKKNGNSIVLWARTEVFYCGGLRYFPIISDLHFYWQFFREKAHRGQNTQIYPKRIRFFLTKTIRML